MEIGFLRHEKILPKFSSLLLKNGLSTVYFPLVSYEAIDFTISSTSLTQYTGVILCSKRAVDIFLSKLKQEDYLSLTVHCVGERAKARLQSYGIVDLICYSNFLQMAQSFSQDDKLLYPASNEYSKDELEIAQNNCCGIDVLICYEVHYEKMDVGFQDWLKTKDNKALAVLAPSQAKALESYDCKSLDAFCMGQRTQKALQNLNIDCIHLSKEPNMLSLIDSIQEYFSERC
ncbi:MAG: uroporphyrinogen-III synthase [Candidatus Cloacimonetes bacterium]|nr:uroporphyrinogen-III synthase [Candidatus Cloacimonadota bacterium]